MQSNTLIPFRRYVSAKCTIFSIILRLSGFGKEGITTTLVNQFINVYYIAICVHWEIRLWMAESLWNTL